MLDDIALAPDSLYPAAREAPTIMFAITADNRCYRLGPHAPKTLCESLITNYSMRPAERFGPLAQQQRLLLALGSGGKRGRIGVDFLEGTILGLDYKLGSIDAIAEAMNTRQKFVAAGSAALALELVDMLD